MLKKQFVIALRSLLKNKVFSAINILGLAIGISASLVIFLLVDYHFSFDKFEQDGDRIYRVVSKFSFSGEVYYNSGVTSPMGPAIQKEVTGLAEVVPFRVMDGPVKVGIPVIGKPEPVIFKKQNSIVFVNKNFIDLIGYKWLAGSASSAFLQPYQTILTASRAKMYFPNLTATEVIGKELYLNDTVRTTIAGVVADIQHNTDFTFQVFISSITLERTSLKPEDYENWNNTNGASQLLVKLNKGTSPLVVQAQIRKLYEKYHQRDPEDHTNSTTDYILEPLSELHFNADYSVYDLPVANRPTLYGLLAVAGFLLLLGCINFINLTTAQASQRAKEIGIRKTLGSSRKQLVSQFFRETFLLTLSATLLSVILTPFILKAFAGFIPDTLHFDLIERPIIIGFLFILILLVTVLAGFYPALVLSRYKPVMVLKNQINTATGNTRSAWLRKSLTVSQFVIAQVFIMATILVGKQISFSLNKDLGFKKEAIVHFETSYYDTVKTNKEVLLAKLKAIPEIVLVSLSSATPSSYNTWSGTMTYKDGKKQTDVDVQQKYVDTNFVSLFHLKLLAGKNIEYSDTVNGYMINETYARVLGFRDPQQAIGKYLEWSNKQIPIVGVMADFHQRSLHEPIKPLAVGSWRNTERTFNIALQPQNAQGNSWPIALAKMTKAFNEIYPDEEIGYSFFDDDLAKYYEQEQHISSLLKWATGLAILISCLGLLGLVIYTTTQRTKEIGVRKVLGAKVSQIVAMISKDFFLLIAIAFFIAAPLAWIGMHKWLQNFAYHTEISWWIFFLGGLLMILMALVTLCFQTVKAAIANPVKSLRSE